MDPGRQPLNVICDVPLARGRHNELLEACRRVEGRASWQGNHKEVEMMVWPVSFPEAGA